MYQRVRVERIGDGWVARDMSYPQTNVPMHIMEEIHPDIDDKIGVLLTCEDGVTIEGVGYRFTEDILYLDY